MLIVLKMMVSALVIGGINVIAQTNPKLAGWMTALPVVSLLSVGWLMIDRKNNAEIAIFIIGVLYGLLPTAAVLFIMVLLIGYHTPVPIAVGVSVAVCAFFTFAVARLGLFAA
jgi:hypothetical protein